MSGAELEPEDTGTYRARVPALNKSTGEINVPYILVDCCQRHEHMP